MLFSATYHPPEAPRAIMAGKKRNSGPPKKLTASDIAIPDKLYFRIGEVAELCGVPAYVLRFWETEFPHLRPTKSSTGQRTYRRREVEAILRVRSLLYDQGFTIPGARQFLRTETRSAKSQSLLPFAPPPRSQDALRQVKHELQDLLSILSARR